MTTSFGIDWSCKCQSPEDPDSCLGIQIGTFGCLMQNTAKIFNLLVYPLTSTFTLPIALLLCLQWHHFRADNLRLFGKQVVILWLYYGDVFRDNHGNSNKDAFTDACFFILLEEVVLFYPLKHLYETCIEKRGIRHFEHHFLELGPQYQDRFARLRNKEEADDNDTAFNIYMDFRKPFRKAAMTFFAQFGLVWYYVLEMNGGSHDDESPGRSSHHMKEFDLFKWFFAVLLVYVSGDDESGPGCAFEFWRQQFKKLETDYDYVTPFHFNPLDPSHWCKLCTFQVPGWHLMCRFFFDFFINSLARSLIRGTAAIMLSVEGPLDFVKDATAVFFIMKLDDWEYDVNLTEWESWDFTREDIGYSVEEFCDPFYQIGGDGKICTRLGFPTSKEIIDEIWDRDGPKSSCSTYGCIRDSYNKKDGYPCCRTCAKTNGKEHGPNCDRRFAKRELLMGDMNAPLLY